jgi:hypothetical protein
MFMSGQVVPALYSSESENFMRRLFKDYLDICEAKSAATQLHPFRLLIKFNNKDLGLGVKTFCTELVRLCTAHSAENPDLKWSKDSRSANPLGINQIHPLHEHPLIVDHQILRPRLHHFNIYSMKFLSIYAAQDEDRWHRTMFKAVNTAGVVSSFGSNSRIKFQIKLQ